MKDPARPRHANGEDRREVPKKQTQSEESMQFESLSTTEDWRRTAQQMQSETDPAKLMDLAQTLIDEFDRCQVGSPSGAEPSELASDCKPDVLDKDKDVHLQGEQHGTRRPTR